MVTAGGTHEAIDPVRFIANKSSGKQGVAFAKAASARGADVTLIGANIAQVGGVNFVPVETALELQEAVESRLKETDYLVMTAAVSDFRVKSVSEQKIKRAVLGNNTSIELVANPDILHSAVGHIRENGLAIKTVGFAAETARDSSDMRQLAAHKLMSKGCDLLVANDVTAGKTFGEDSNSVLILSKGGVEKTYSGTKSQVASVVLDILIGI